ncbi:hypothetical protein NESM_000397600 [Novymonas esmeraldas]|uniref:Uncharacterized protein n=1 Tax=Novymonas esmeraldas TaxID=1808958 RepID=A0AAW0EM11_9TRYP
MASDAAFTAFASAAVAAELRAHFPDTAVCRRLRHGGPLGSAAFLYREYTPASACSAGDHHDRTSSTPPNKRQRTTIVCALQKELADFTAATSASTGAAADAVAGAVACASPSPPYSAECRRCTTTIVSTYPCEVLLGYVVVWAESVLEIECVPRAAVATPTEALSHSPAAAAAVPTDVHERASRTTGARGGGSSADVSVLGARTSAAPGRPLSASTPPMGLRPLLHRRQATAAAAVRAPPRGSPSAAPVVSLALHSLHIVKRDAATKACPASFVLQSVLQPGWPTALECYPRHMVHFGLLVFAAWRADARTWRTALIGRDGGDDCAAAAAPQARVSSRRAAVMEEAGGDLVAALLPHAAEDAVLVLGLGGNVLGRCLDALLPAAVPLHVVEVEPAVLQACCEHGQFPAAHTVTRGRIDVAGTASQSAAPRLSSATPRTAGRCAGPGRMSGAATASPPPPPPPAVLTSALRAAAQSIHAKSDTPVTVTAARQQLSCSPPVAPPRRASAAAVAPATAASSSSSYVCFLQDAYAFLGAGTPGTAADVAGAALRCRRARPARGAAHPGSDAAAAPPVQYSLIFLDCYDPDREHMMHEGTLVQMCARRLRPGGVLLVNAHVLPTEETLRRDFLGCGFATVQALRVTGCTQTVVACVARDRDDGDGDSSTAARHAGRSGAPTLAEKRSRFTVRQMQLLAAALNRDLRRRRLGGGPVDAGERATARGAAAPAATAAAPVFQLDASWLRLCRRIAASSEEDDVHVWQHHF